ncbi:MAG: metal-dependent hydrolase [Cryomorphaceae bacterium]|nr:metal-dependent hydrolase [Cryomorphaceae bacterium]
MDSLSQLVLGAATAEAIAGKKVGNKAILWGAIGGTIPDLDVFLRPFVNDIHGIDWHRGVSHSFLFFILISPLLGRMVSRIYKNNHGSAKFWGWVMFATLVTHVLLDCFTTWGTQLFWPLQTRVAWHTVFVADPLYTVPLLISVLVVLFIKRTKISRQVVNWVGLSLSSAYLALTVVHKNLANDAFERAFAAQGINVEYFESRPTPLNTILWSGTAKSGDGYYVGYYSLFDSLRPEEMKLSFVPANHDLAIPYANEKDVKQLIFLSQGFYSVEPAEPGVVINDLRFGQIAPFDGSEAQIVFGFHVIPENGSVEIVQNEQPSPSGDEASLLLKALFNRLKGI